MTLEGLMSRWMTFWRAGRQGAGDADPISTTASTGQRRCVYFRQQRLASISSMTI